MFPFGRRRSFAQVSTTSSTTPALAAPELAPKPAPATTPTNVVSTEHGSYALGDSKDPAFRAQLEVQHANIMRVANYVQDYLDGIRASIPDEQARNKEYAMQLIALGVSFEVLISALPDDMASALMHTVETTCRRLFVQNAMLNQAATDVQTNPDAARA